MGNTQFFDALNGFDGVFLDGVFDFDRAAIFAIDRNVQDGRLRFIHGCCDSVRFHQTRIAGEHNLPIDHAADTLTCDLGRFAYPVKIERRFVLFSDGERDRMVRVCFRHRCDTQQFFAAHANGFDLRYGEGALGDGSRLVEGAGGLYTFGILDQDAAFGCTADAAEEAQGYRDD